MRDINSTTALDTYITTLRALAETCEFETLKDDLIRDRIICGVRDKGIQRKLLQECSLTLSKCVDICRANEATAAQLEDMAPSQTTEQEVNAVNQKERSKKAKTTKNNGRDPKDEPSAEYKYCGYKLEWKRDKCPAYGKTQSLCGKANHFAVKCSKNSRESKNKRSHKFKCMKVNQLDDITESSYSLKEEILPMSLHHTANAVDMSNFKTKIFAHMEIAKE